MTSNIIFPILIGIAVIALSILFFASYIKAAPDEVKIISGFRQLRTIIGHSGFRIPFLEQVDTLSLKLIPIDVKTSGIPTSDYINIAVDAVVQVGKQLSCPLCHALSFLVHHSMNASFRTL